MNPQSLDSQPAAAVEASAALASASVDVDDQDKVGFTLFSDKGSLNGTNSQSSQLDVQ